MNESELVNSWFCFLMSRTSYKSVQTEKTVMLIHIPMSVSILQISAFGIGEKACREELFHKIEIYFYETN